MEASPTKELFIAATSPSVLAEGALHVTHAVEGARLGKAPYEATMRHPYRSQ